MRILEKLRQICTKALERTSRELAVKEEIKRIDRELASITDRRADLCYLNRVAVVSVGELFEATLSLDARAADLRRQRAGLVARLEEEASR